MAVQEAADRVRRDLVAEFEKLAFDATITPPWVLAAQTQNQVAQLVGNRRPASPRPQAKCRPMLPHELVVPAEQRGGRKEQAPRRQSRAQSSQDHPVGRQQVRPLDLPTQNGDLVAEGENLEVAHDVRAAA